MARIKNVDMVNGNLLGAIVRFSVPVIFIGLIQNLFNAVDMMMLGQLADTTAVASVGATSVILGLLVTVFFGFSSGAKVVLARFLGAQDEERVKKTVSTSMLTAILTGLLSAVMGIALAKPFLLATDCPPECLEGALIYIRIYLAAAPAIMVYNYGSAILSVSGDSQRPLYYMMISGGTNVALNFVLCLVLSQKVAAVAIATAVSQLVGAILVVNRLVRMEGLCRLNVKHMRWSNSAFRKLLSNGAPIALSTALYPLANLQIQSAVNSFGPAVMAGNSASGNVENLAATIDSSAWSSSATAFVGQNLGADKKDRVRKTIFYCLGIGVGLSLIISTLGMIFSEPLISLFVGGDGEAIAAAQERMKYTFQFRVIIVVIGVLNHVIQAFGYSIFTTANNIVSVLLFRVFWMAVVYPTEPTFDMLCRCYLVSWCITMAVNVIFTLYLYHGKFKKGKLKRM